MSKNGLSFVPIGSLQVDPEQPRKYIPEDELKRLALSIQRKGILQPLLVKFDSKGQCLIVDGERRYRAALMTDLQELPVMIQEIGDDKLERQLILINIPAIGILLKTLNLIK